MSYLIQIKRKSDWQVFDERLPSKDELIRIIQKFRDDFLIIDWRIFKNVDEIEYIKIFDRNYDFELDWDYFDGNHHDSEKVLDNVPISDYYPEFIPESRDITNEIMHEHFSLKINKIEKIEFKIVNWELFINKIKIELSKKAWKSKCLLSLLCNCLWVLKKSSVTIKELNDFYIENITGKDYEELNSKDLTRLKITNGYLSTINENIKKLTTINEFWKINWELISHM